MKFFSMSFREFLSNPFKMKVNGRMGMGMYCLTHLLSKMGLKPNSWHTKSILTWVTDSSKAWTEGRDELLVLSTSYRIVMSSESIQNEIQ